MLSERKDNHAQLSHFPGNACFFRNQKVGVVKGGHYLLAALSIPIDFVIYKLKKSGLLFYKLSTFIFVFNLLIYIVIKEYSAGIDDELNGLDLGGWLRVNRRLVAQHCDTIVTAPR
ncbi:hypothetical protein ACJX0J_031696 [Zea mays]